MTRSKIGLDQRLEIRLLLLGNNTEVREKDTELPLQDYWDIAGEQLQGAEHLTPFPSSARRSNPSYRKGGSATSVPSFHVISLQQKKDYRTSSS